MSILFDSHEDPTELHSKKIRARSQQDERYPIIQPSSTEKYDEILIFGYQCKLFRDDQIADDINNGKYLIPWMGNKDLMIDRYDCRGHLYRLQEFDFEKMGEFRPLSPERLDVESVCDEERYMELKRNMSDETILQEEEDKRGSALYDPFTAYQNIDYAYEDSTEGKTLSDCSNNVTSNSNFDSEAYAQFCQYYGYNPNDENLKAYFQSQNSYQYDYDRPPPPTEPPPSETQDVATEPAPSTAPAYEVFAPPPGLEIPEGMEVPETRKMQAIIEKTAMFISKQSAQMEIVLKTKQSGNPQFAFLDFDNYLNPYYKFILGKIKDGEYEYTDDIKEEKETNEKNDEMSEDDSDGDENELHPLLQAHRRPVNQPVLSTPPKSPDGSVIDEPIINQIPQTKLTGKVEDLAKVYMTWKYTPNPGEACKDEAKEEEEEEAEQPSLEDVEELPPPPLPPPPNFVLNDANDNMEINSLSQVPDDTHLTPGQYLEQPNEQIPIQIDTQLEGPASQQVEHPPHLLRGGQLFAPPMLPPPPPPSRPLFPQISFQPSPVVQTHFPLQLGPRPFHPIPGHFLGGSFQPMQHTIQYSHPPEIYHVRSSVPPPPPPPIPSLMPPGVDAPINLINIQPIVVTTVGSNEGNLLLPHALNSESSPVVMTHSHSQPIVTSVLQSLPTHEIPLQPPGVENDTTNEKVAVPPPPPPPLPPCIEHYKTDITELYTPNDSPNEPPEDIIENNVSSDETLCETKGNTSKSTRKKHRHKKYIEDRQHGSSDEDITSNRTSKQFSNSHSQSLSEQENKFYHRESKRRKKSSKNRNIDLKSDIDLSHILESSEHSVSSTQYEATNQYEARSNDNNNSVQSYQQLNLQCSTIQTLSPFMQINQVLKSMPGPSTSLCSTQITTGSSVTTLPTKIVTPGKDLQLVIDRLALYVAKNGDEFEVGIKEKKDPRFDFLNPWNIYHPYYSGKKKSNLEKVIKEKEEEEERRKNLKVKFGLKTKVKPVAVAQKNTTTTAASVFNQNEEEEEEETNEPPTEGFQPNKDPEIEVKRRLQKQIEEKEKLLKQLHEQALLQQKIAEVNRQASIKPMLQNLTPQQQALLKKKVHEKQQEKQSKTTIKQDERKKRAASFVGMLKKNADAEDSNDLAGNFLRKRQFKESSSSKGNNSEPPDKAAYEKKKDAFFKAINDAFKGT